MLLLTVGHSLGSYFLLSRMLHEIGAQLFLLLILCEIFFPEILEGFKSEDIFSNFMTLEFPFLCINAISKPDCMLSGLSFCVLILIWMFLD